MTTATRARAETGEHLEDDSQYRGDYRAVHQKIDDLRSDMSNDDRDIRRTARLNHAELTEKIADVSEKSRDGLAELSKKIGRRANAGVRQHCRACARGLT